MRSPDRSPGTLLEIASCDPRAFHPSSNRLNSATTGGGAASSTRSTRAASPTRMATASATCGGSSTTSITWARTGSASTPSGCRRSTRRRAATSATTSATTRSVDPLFGTRGRLRPARRGGPRRGHPRRPRPGHEPHQRRASLVRRLARVADRARTPTGTCGATRPGTAPDGAPLPPNNWVSFFGGPGWQWEPAREQFYYHTFLVEQPELNWRAPGVEAAQFAMVRGWLDRGVDGFRLDVFNVFLKHPDAALEPDPRGHVGVGSPGPPSTTATSPTSRRSSAGSGRSSTSSPGGCPSASCSTARSRRRAGLTADRHLVFDWELVEPAVERRRPCAPRSRRARRPSAPTAGRPSSCPTTTSRATRRDSRRSAGGGRPATRSRRAAAVLLADPARHAVPVLRRGARAGRRRRPADRERRSAGRAGRARLRLVGPLAHAGRRCPGRPGPGAGFTTGRPWLPPRRRRGDRATSRSRPARPGLDAVALSPADRAPGGDARRSRSGRSTLDPAADGDVLAYAREAAGQRRARRAQPAGAGRPPGPLAGRAPAATAGGSLLTTAAATRRRRSDRDGRARPRDRLDEAVVLERSS